MSYDEHYSIQDNPMQLARMTRAMLAGSHLTLMNIIDHNIETNPKPHHMNKHLMTAALKMEADNASKR